MTSSPVLKDVQPSNTLYPYPPTIPLGLGGDAKIVEFLDFQSRKRKRTVTCVLKNTLVPELFFFGLW